MQKGQISVQTENIFPIIKKFLYSDQDIFLRELVSNAVDATSKLKTLHRKNEFSGELGSIAIDISIDKEQNTLTIKDRGIGMTEEEVLKYLNQVAFSSASEFLEKYKDESQIIGHFGLGFYSAFMVASKVEVRTLSYKEGAKAVQWTCLGDTEYSLETIDKSERGTEIILHITEDAKEFLEQSTIENLLNKYCKFLPIPIVFGEEEISEGEEDKTEVQKQPRIINNTEPIWKKQPNEIQEEDYKSFYQELYPFSQPPLFWIHLNIDYPFRLTGILYFPKLQNGLEVQKNKIQLYSNQVFVTDDVKEIVPEFLTLLHGVIDSPDIPLNVSRSYLQSDSNVKKITNYITRKVAEKLGELFKNERENYQSKWDDIGPFIKYGVLSNDKFEEKAKEYVLLKSTDNAYFTVQEYKESVKEIQTNKDNKVVFLYTSVNENHDHLIEQAKEKGYKILMFDQMLDSHFLQNLEYKDQDLTFVRIDSNTLDQLIEKEDKTESVMTDKEVEIVKGVFESTNKDSAGKIVVKALSPQDDPVVITRPEFMRRMKEMQALQGMDSSLFPDSYEIVVNSNHELINGNLMKNKSKEEQEALATYLCQLAKLNQQMLKGKELNQFIRASLHRLQ
jgi:molecular chaperone HtpG